VVDTRGWIEMRRNAPVLCHGMPTRRFPLSALVRHAAARSCWGLVRLTA
jgi:hypothetical protein